MKIDSKRSPEVSVIMPTYNRAHLIESSVASVLNQTLSDLELIVIDDGSTDGTKAVIENIGDPRILYVRNEGTKGVSAARNVGIALARGRWLGFLDSDDTWDSQKLKLQVRVLEGNPAVDGVVCGWRWVEKKTGQVRIERIPEGSGRIDGLPRWAYNTCPDLLVSREVVQQSFFDESLTTYECMDWIVRLWSVARFATMPNVLVNCYDHAGPRASNGQLRSLKALEEVVGRYEAFMRADKNAWCALNLQLGAGFLVASNDRRRARHYLARSLRANPGNARAWAYIAASGVPTRLMDGVRNLVSFRKR